MRAAPRLRWFLCLPMMCLAVSNLIAQAVSDCVLAQRYRPYVKMSKGRGSDEPYHPANWDWVVKQSTLKQGNKTLVTADQWSPDYKELLTKGSDLTVSPSPSGITLGVPEGIYGGEPWSDVIHKGHGIYAHVEHVSPSLVNIEYYILYANNEPPLVPSQQHSGDLTTVVVEYDSTAQVVTRVIYNAHGCLVNVDQMRSGQTVSYGVLAGTDENAKPSETQVAQIVADIDYDSKNPCTIGLLHKATPNFFMAEDAYTHVYQHPAVYVEVGDHEMWGNSQGFLTSEGGHDGTATSFLPDVVQMFGNVDNPAPGQQSFVRYNGKFGSDPASPALHKAWCWVPSAMDKDLGTTPCVAVNPLGITNFADMDPYRQIGSKVWPPPPYAAGSTDVYIAQNTSTGVTGLGTQAEPFPDFKLAYSVVAAGRILHVGPGVYGGNIILSKPMTITAQTDAFTTIGGALGLSPVGTAPSPEQVCSTSDN